MVFFRIFGFGKILSKNSTSFQEPQRILGIRIQLPSSSTSWGSRSHLDGSFSSNCTLGQVHHCLGAPGSWRLRWCHRDTCASGQMLLDAAVGIRRRHMPIAEQRSMYSGNRTRNLASSTSWAECQLPTPIPRSPTTSVLYLPASLQATRTRPLV